MLSRMDDFECQASMGLQGAHDRGNFHEIWPSSCDEIYFSHGFAAISQVREPRTLL